MSRSEAYVYSDDNYTGIYCLSCATGAWKQEAQRIVSHGDDADDIIRELRDGNRPQWLDDGECSRRGETCEECDEEVCPPYYTCDGCDHTGWANEGFARVIDDDTHAIDWDGEGPHTAWCDECEEDNRHDGVALLLDDDGRGYKLRFIPAYTGVLTYEQPDGCSWTDEPIPVYAAGCRRFTLADALHHWGASHYTVAGRREGCPVERTAAYRLSSAVLRHAMRQALPRIVIPSERAADDAYAAAAA